MSNMICLVLLNNLKKSLSFLTSVLVFSCFYFNNNLCMVLFRLIVSPLVSLPVFLPRPDPLFPCTAKEGTVYPRLPTDPDELHCAKQWLHRKVCVHTHAAAQTHTLHGKSHQDILIVSGCSPPLPISSLPASRKHSNSVMILHTG